MAEFNPERILTLNPELKKYAEELHHSEKFNDVASIALAGFVVQAHPSEQQSLAITAFLRYLTSLGSPAPQAPEPLTMPSLIPPDQIAAMTAKKESERRAARQAESKRK